MVFSGVLGPTAGPGVSAVLDACSGGLGLENRGYCSSSGWPLAGGACWWGPSCVGFRV